jgi:hypothetical protein
MKARVFIASIKHKYSFLVNLTELRFCCTVKRYFFRGYFSDCIGCEVNYF